VVITTSRSARQLDMFLLLMLFADIDILKKNYITLSDIL
jgi:hypothetical protein